MKNLLSLAVLCISFTTLFSCSKDSNNDSNLVGIWKLTNYDIGVSTDVDKDGVEHKNILNEIVCSVNETLEFETNKSMTSSDSFHHEVKVSKVDDSYLVNVECSDGYISSINVLTEEEFTEYESYIEGNQLTLVYANAVKVYNEDFTEVIETKDLIKVYTK